MRSPFLKLGGDTQFTMLSNNHFDYDCSMATRFDDDGDGDGDGVLSRDFGYLDAQNGLYPYTLDYASVQVGFWPKIFLADTWKSNIYVYNSVAGLRRRALPHLQLSWTLGAAHVGPGRCHNIDFLQSWNINIAIAHPSQKPLA